MKRFGRSGDYGHLSDDDNNKEADRNRSITGKARGFLFKEAPEERSKRFFERNADNIKKLQEDMNNKRALDLMHANIQDIEKSFDRHTDCLQSQTNDYIERREAYKEAKKTYESSDTANLHRAGFRGTLTPKDKTNITNLYTSASDYVKALSERLNSSKPEEGNNPT